MVYPFQLAYGESIILNQVRLLQTGQSIYQNIEVYPYINTCYTPCYQVLLRLVSPAGQLSFLTGRTISLLSALAVCLLLLVNLRAAGLTPTLAIPLSLYFLLSHPTPVWATLCRVDLLALFLMIGAYSFLNLSESRKAVFCSGLCSALAVLTKQSFLLGTAGLVFFLLIRRRRDLPAFLSALLLPLLCIGGWLQAASGGEFIKQTIFYNIHPFLTAQLAHFSLLFLRHHWFLLLGCFLYIHLGITRSNGPFPYYLPFALLVLLGIGKSGAAENYFLELMAVSIMISGIVLKQIFSTRIFWPRVAACSLLALAFFTNALNPIPQMPSAAERQAKLKTLAVFQQLKGPVLARDHEFAVLSGKQLVYEPHQLANLYTRGIFKADNLLADIANTRFTMIELYPFPQEDYFPTDFRDAVLASYNLEFSLFGRNYYFPRKHCEH